jgi:hypothetical protein
MKNLISYIKNLIDKKFHGKLIISFEAGRISRVEIRKTEDASMFN